jgi:hypothetical protein
MTRRTIAALLLALALLPATPARADGYLAKDGGTNACCDH